MIVCAGGMRGGGGSHTLRGTGTPLLAGLRSAACCAISSAPSKISNDMVSGVGQWSRCSLQRKVLRTFEFLEAEETQNAEHAKKSLRKETEDSALGCEEAGT